MTPASAKASPQQMTADGWRERADASDWDQIRSELDAVWVRPDRAAAHPGRGRRHHRPVPGQRPVPVHGQHGPLPVRRGRIQYFAEPFPDAITGLKQALYPKLLPIARDWWSKLGRETPWPGTLDEWLDMCHAAGQTRSTPILLNYQQGGWNALHRDLYGELVFPLQVVINLSYPGVDHTGGEFLLYEQRPRAQSRATATLIPHGHGLVFTTRERPVPSARGWSIGPVRHGVSVIRSGQRFTLGLVFHDAA